MDLFKKYWWAFALYILVVMAAPAVLSKLTTWIEFDTNSGVIGDTIGGITAPFINLLAAFLVYLSFEQQVKANKQLSKENKLNYYSNFYEILQKQISETNDKPSKKIELYIRDYFVLIKQNTFESIYLDRKNDSELEDTLNKNIHEHLNKLYSITNSLVNFMTELFNEMEEPNNYGIYRFYLDDIFGFTEKLDLKLILDSHLEYYKDGTDVLNKDNAYKYLRIIEDCERLKDRKYIK